MTRMRAFAVTLVLALVSFGAMAQEKPATPPAKAEVPIKLRVVFSEFEGEKKVSSLPYELSLMATDPAAPPRYTHFRMGLNVPVPSSSGGTFQYQSVGTDIDSHARIAREGQFSVGMSLRRSTIHQREEAGKAAEFAPAPIVRTFSAEVEFLIRDGQTIQSTLATDPLSGRVLKVDVTLTVQK